MAFAHRSVLLLEAVEALRPRPGGIWMDCTLGGAGHAEAILRATSPSGRLAGIDRDPAAVEAARERLLPFGKRAMLRCAPFSRARQVLDELGVGRVDGMIADLGLSSPQIEDPGRGFSFERDGPLDMRMGPDAGRSAAELLSEVDERALARLLRRYGELRQPRRVARAVMAAMPVRTTGELAAAVESAAPRGPRRVSVLARAFMALRIATNRELEELEALLALLPELLAPGARVAIVAFHSLEDRLVKRRFRELAGEGGERDPYGRRLRPSRARLVGRKALRSRDDNRRARSARMRVLEWVG